MSKLLVTRHSSLCYNLLMADYTRLLHGLPCLPKLVRRPPMFRISSRARSVASFFLLLLALMSTLGASPSASAQSPLAANPQSPERSEVRNPQSAQPAPPADVLSF